MPPLIIRLNENMDVLISDDVLSLGDSEWFLLKQICRFWSGAVNTESKPPPPQSSSTSLVPDLLVRPQGCFQTTSSLLVLMVMQNPAESHVQHLPFMPINCCSPEACIEVLFEDSFGFLSGQALRLRARIKPRSLRQSSDGNRPDLNCNVSIISWRLSDASIECLCDKNPTVRHVEPNYFSSWWPEASRQSSEGLK